MAASHNFGADLTNKQFALLCIALCTGTLIEWYDFTIYSQLSNVLTDEFFPAKDPIAQQLSYWAVFALGFIARPLGSLIFGHVGDSDGRRTTLLLSILCISIPTILIGCLPTFRMIGIAAPVLLAILRFVQGLAVGGEFGSAIVYLFETAPAHRKGTIASLGQAAIAPGISAGLIACIVVMYACSPAQLALWGWRIPFLLTAFFAPVSVILRMHMPEPREFLISKQEMVLQRVASKAASRTATSFSKQYSRQYSSPASATLSRINSRQLSHRLQTLTEVVVLPSATASGTGAPMAAVADVESPADDQKAQGTGDITSVTRPLSITHSAIQTPYIQATEVKFHTPHHDSALSAVQPELSSAKGALHETRWPASAAPSLSAALSKELTAQRALSQHDLELDKAVRECEGTYAAEVQQLSGVVKRHMPLLVLARDHWREVLLQFLLESNYGAVFYTYFSWVPSYLRQINHTNFADTLWPILIGMLLFPFVATATGRYINDTRVPKIWAFLGMTLFSGVVSIPLLLYLNSGAVVAQWLLLPIMVGLSGVCGGLMTSIGPQIYPPAVRTSGFNLGHSLAMTIFGGFSPMAISALSVSIHPPALSAGVIVVITAVIPFIVAVPLVKLVPAINSRAPAGVGLQSIDMIS